MVKPGQEQEESLRRWMAGQGETPRGVDAPQHSASSRIMAITSGKGGVGKSNVTLNLGLALAKAGQRVILLDADLGLANINILLGMQPEDTLADVLEGQKLLRDILWNGPHGIRVIPGASGIARLAAALPEEIDRIIQGFRAIEGDSDWLLIDTGAGIAPNVMSFVLAADEVLVVTSPEPTALADAYGLIKAIWESSQTPTIRLLVNRAESLDRAERMGRRIIDLASKMLEMEIEWAGLVQDDARVPMAIGKQMPFILAYPGTIASRDVQALADRLLKRGRSPTKTQATVGRFIERLRSVVLPSDAEGAHRQATE